MLGRGLSKSKSRDVEDAGLEVGNYIGGFLSLNLVLFPCHISLT